MEWVSVVNANANTNYDIVPVGAVLEVQTTLLN